MEEPRLTTPIFMSFLAGLLFFVGYRINPQTTFQEGIRLLLVLLGAICALWAFVTGMDYLINRGIIHLKAVRQAWYAPTLALAREVNAMNRDQLRLFERIGPFENIGYLTSAGPRWMLYTPMGNIPYTWVTEYLEKCIPTYPKLIPQHGMTDSLQRDYVQWFTTLMVHNEMAEKAIGNRPATWTVPLDVVQEKLGLEEV